MEANFSFSLGRTKKKCYHHHTIITLSGQKLASVRLEYFNLLLYVFIYITCMYYLWLHNSREENVYHLFYYISLYKLLSVHWDHNLVFFKNL